MKDRANQSSQATAARRLAFDRFGDMNTHVPQREHAVGGGACSLRSVKRSKKS